MSYYCNGGVDHGGIEA